MSETTPHSSASRQGPREPMRCVDCREVWPCRAELLRENGSLRSEGAAEFHRHRAAEVAAEARSEQRFLRSQRIVIIPLAVLAAVEAGVLIGLWCAR